MILYSFRINVNFAFAITEGFVVQTVFLDTSQVFRTRGIFKAGDI